MVAAPPSLACPPATRRLLAPRLGLLVLLVGVTTACANTSGVNGASDAPADGCCEAGQTVDAVAETAANPDDADVLAPQGVCESAAEWFNLGHVLDGDTITIDDGLFSHVRLLGVAAPEIAHPPKDGECFGLQAWQAAKQWLPEDSGVKICVKPDPNADDKDKYGRLLRYAYFKDKQGRIVQLNARQIRRGNARLYRAYSNGLTLEGVFASLENAAKSEGLGGWSACAWQPRAP